MELQNSALARPSCYRCHSMQYCPWSYRFDDLPTDLSGLTVSWWARCVPLWFFEVWEKQRFSGSPELGLQCHLILHVNHIQWLFDVWICDEISFTHTNQHIAATSPVGFAAHTWHEEQTLIFRIKCSFGLRVTNPKLCQPPSNIKTIFHSGWVLASHNNSLRGLGLQTMWGFGFELVIR